MKEFKYQKAVQLLVFFAAQANGTINKMKAIKLVWLSDRLHLRKYGRTITGDEYFAMPYGPVASSTRDLLQNTGQLSQEEAEYISTYLGGFTQYNYNAVQAIDQEVLSATDLEVIRLIYDQYGHYDHFKLSEHSHAFPEWKQYEEVLAQKSAQRYPINEEDFFMNCKDFTNLFVDDESSLAITKSIFQNYKSYTALL